MQPSRTGNMNEKISFYQQALIELTSRINDGDGVRQTNVPGLKTVRTCHTSCTHPTIYEPMFCLLLQGGKKLRMGEKEINFKEMSYLMVPVMLPVIGEIVNACNDKPYVGVSIDLDMRILSELVSDMGEGFYANGPNGCCMNNYDVDESILSVFQRLLQLHEAPKDIPVLLPMLKRELMYRVLNGPGGVQLRQFLMHDSNASRMSKVIEMIRANFDEPLKVKQLANAVNMSESALYNSFKSVTSMSPLQYQKQLRLNEARRIMIHEGLEAATAGYKVGYGSPSQFSREYSRLFGAPPAADINRVRNSVGA